MQTKNLAGLYNLPPLEWEPISARLGEAVSQAPDSGGPNRHTCWLATLNPDGSPHVTALGALWVGDAFWFVTGERSRKGENLERDPRCAMSVSVHDADVVFEGEARRVAERDMVAAMAERWASGGWPCRVDDSGAALTAEYSAPSAGPPPWAVCKLAPQRATALSTVEPAAPPAGPSEHHRAVWAGATRSGSKATARM
jgi:hypothetical protein